MPETDPPLDDARSTATGTRSGCRWTDATGKPWDFRLKLSDAQRLKATHDLFNPDTIKATFGNPLSLIEFIGELMRPSWEAEGLSYETFSDLLTATDDSFDLASSALMHSLADFFRRVGQRELAVLVDRAATAAKMVSDEAVRKLERESPKLVTAIVRQSSNRLDREIAKALAIANEQESAGD